MKNKNTYLLRRLIKESIALNDYSISNVSIEIETEDDPYQELKELLGWIRALQLWFHSAHHVVKGHTFSGDHGILLDRIYTEIEDSFDGAVEKIIGVTEDLEAACPQKHLSIALSIMNQFGSPPCLTTEQIMKNGLLFEKAFIEKVEYIFNDLEECKLLSLGLNDFLASLASDHETYVYLLQQRVN